MIITIFGKTIEHYTKEQLWDMLGIMIEYPANTIPSALIDAFEPKVTEPMSAEDAGMERPTPPPKNR